MVITDMRLPSGAVTQCHPIKIDSDKRDTPIDKTITGAILKV